MTLTEILEELSGRSFETSDYATSDKSEKNINRKWDRRIAQAKKAIEEMFGEWVPSEKKDDYRGEFMIDTGGFKEDKNPSFASSANVVSFRDGITEIQETVNIGGTFVLCGTSFITMKSPQGTTVEVCIYKEDKKDPSNRLSGEIPRVICTIK